ncbi:MAG: hypothetical protein R8M45_05500 [Ghiorsea sp.]
MADINESSYMNDASKTIEHVLNSTLPVHEKVGILAEKSSQCDTFSQALAFKVVEQHVRKIK